MKNEMRRNLFIGILFLVAAVRPAAGQSILPSSFGGWNASGPAAVAPVGGLSALEPQGAPDLGILKEYFLKSTEMRSYTHGAQTSAITLYRFRDPSSAYGAYTFLRSDS